MNRVTTFRVSVIVEGDYESASVVLGCEQSPVSLADLVIATEHMMTAVGLKSGMGFEEAMKSLVEGAGKNRVHYLDGKQVGN